MCDYKFLNEKKRVQQSFCLHRYQLHPGCWILGAGREQFKDCSTELWSPFSDSEDGQDLRKTTPWSSKPTIGGAPHSYSYFCSRGPLVSVWLNIKLPFQVIFGSKSTSKVERRPTTTLCNYKVEVVQNLSANSSGSLLKFISYLKATYESVLTEVLREMESFLPNHNLEKLFEKNKPQKYILFYKMFLYFGQESNSPYFRETRQTTNIFE